MVCADTVDFHRPIYLRRIVVRNLRDGPRHVRLFFHHDFYLFRDGVGDTTYFDPLTRGIVHHKRDVLFMANAWAGEQPGFDAVSTGTKHLHGLEGTWRDAEDGNLSGNAIAQGLVDSTGGVEVRVPAGGEAVAHYWLAVGDEFFSVKDDNDMVVQRGPRHPDRTHQPLLAALGHPRIPGLHRTRSVRLRSLPPQHAHRPHSDR